MADMNVKPGACTSREVIVQAGQDKLGGNLTVPAQSTAIVLFVHGSGSSRFSTRNRFVAETLNNAGLATLLFDLLTDKEEDVDRFTREYRFDIPLLARRLVAAIDWVKNSEITQALQIGLFGSSTGAAAALIGSIQRADDIGAIVSRGGRPDLAGDYLPQVKVPTLLIIGGNDSEVIRLNEQAARLISCERQIEIVPGATHLFEEPGKLEQVAKLASDWFVKHLHESG